MNFCRLTKRFFKEESGAVTVDWVVLTAAIVGLGIAVLATVTSQVNTVSGNIKSELTDVTAEGIQKDNKN